MIGVISNWRIWKALFGGGKILVICPSCWDSSGEELASGDAASLGDRYGPVGTQICRQSPAEKTASCYVPRWSLVISHRDGSDGLRRQPGRKSSLTPLGSSAVSKSLGQTKTLVFSWLLNLYTIFHQGLGYTLEDITSSCLQ